MRQLTQPAGAARLPLVLLVDDFPDALGTYADYMQRHGLRVEIARHPTEAIDRIRRTERPAVVVMDLEMHGSTATYAMRLLKVDTATKDIPIVAFTGQGEKPQREQALRDGFDAVIPKPCLPDDLLSVIRPYLRTHLDRRSSDRRSSDRRSSSRSSNGVNPDSPTCPQCHARKAFQVGPATASGPRWFRCSVCAELWLVHPTGKQN